MLYMHLPIGGISEEVNRTFFDEYVILKIFFLVLTFLWWSKIHFCLMKSNNASFYVIQTFGYRGQLRRGTQNIFSDKYDIILEIFLSFWNFSLLFKNTLF